MKVHCRCFSEGPRIFRCVTGFPSSISNHFAFHCKQLIPCFVDATNYAKCHLARAPAHALLARNNVNLAEYQTWMQNAMLVAGPRLFDKKIFSDDTTGLRVVGPGFQRYNQYLAPNYAKSLEALDNCRKDASTSGARALGLNWLLLAVLWCFCRLLVVEIQAQGKH